MTGRKRRDGGKLVYKVFIAHAAQDAPLALRIRERIEEVGAEAWLDSAESDFGAGFLETVHGRLRQSDEVLVIASKRSVRNFWMSGEIGAAIALGKRIVPVMESVEPSDLPAALRSLEAVDVSHLDRYLAQLVYRIRADKGKRAGEKSRRGA
jgi:hypothetical protein